MLASVVVFAGRPTAEAEPVAPADGYGFSIGAPQIWMSPEDADRELDGARQCGMKVLGLIVNTPGVGQGARHCTLWAADQRCRLRHIAATVVIRNRDRVSDWEIWNEPYLPRFLGFAERQAAVYTGLLKAAYPAINPCNRTPRSSPPG